MSGGCGKGTGCVGAVWGSGMAQKAGTWRGQNRQAWEGGGEPDGQAAGRAVTRQCVLVTGTIEGEGKGRSAQRLGMAA